jgi:hypothetical protein
MHEQSAPQPTPRWRDDLKTWSDQPKTWSDHEVWDLIEALADLYEYGHVPAARPAIDAFWEAISVDAGI